MLNMNFYEAGIMRCFMDQLYKTSLYWYAHLMQQRNGFEHMYDMTNELWTYIMVLK